MPKGQGDCKESTNWQSVSVLVVSVAAVAIASSIDSLVIMYPRAGLLGTTASRQKESKVISILQYCGAEYS
jgi:hypothetical protein